LAVVIACVPALAAPAGQVGPVHPAVPDRATAGTAPQTLLNDVDCVSATFCMAVGSLGDAALAERWNGQDWSVLPSPSQDLGLQAVSCVSASTCVATGIDGQANAFEEWNGSTWRQLPSAGQGVIFSSISCPSQTYCVALGSYQGNLYAGEWNGKAWTVQGTYEPGGPGQDWGGVSCLAATDCMAVAYGYINNNDGIAYSLRWNGSAWSSNPLIVPDYNSLDPWPAGISCTSASYCVTVGDDNGTTQADRWNGTRWKLMTTPTPAGLYSGPDGVSCPRASQCIAAGTTGNIGGNIFAEQLTGNTWKLMKSVVTQHRGYNNLEAEVSCTSLANCMAVGVQDGHGSRGLNPLSETWNGRVWQVQPVPSGT
jgi:hypothetical protein